MIRTIIAAILTFIVLSYLINRAIDARVEVSYSTLIVPTTTSVVEVATDYEPWQSESAENVMQVTL